MTLIVGYSPEERGRAALHLAAILARSAHDDIVVCSVVPTPWIPGMARIDAEYRRYLDATADGALEQARATLSDDVAASFVRHTARSAPAGLLEVANERGANFIVLGSSSAGVLGHIALGSVTDRLLHSSPVSLALATRGFKAEPAARVRRVTVAFGAAEQEGSLIVAAASVAAQVDVAMRVASFAVWARPEPSTTLGTDSEDAILEEWRATIKEATDAALARVDDLPQAPGSLECVIGRGRSWGQALDDLEWQDGDLLVVGSSGIGPMTHVFLGSRAAKILRHSPVPVIVVPRRRAEQLAHEAVER